GQVLQHLVRVHDVEGGIGVAQRVDVTDCEHQVGTGGVGGRLRHDLRHRVDGGHVPVRHPLGQARGDRAGTAANVEDLHRGSELGQQVSGRVLGSAPGVRLQDGGVMTVDVYVCHGRYGNSVLHREQLCLII